MDYSQAIAIGPDLLSKAIRHGMTTGGGAAVATGLGADIAPLTGTGALAILLGFGLSYLNARYSRKNIRR